MPQVGERPAIGRFPDPPARYDQRHLAHFQRSVRNSLERIAGSIGSGREEEFSVTGTENDGDLLKRQSGEWASVATITAADIGSGTFADARIAQSNVTQHEAALAIAESQIVDGSLLARLAANESVTGLWSFSPSGASGNVRIEGDGNGIVLRFTDVGPHGLRMETAGGAYETAFIYRTGPNQWLIEDESDNDYFRADNDNKRVTVNEEVDNGMGTGNHAVVNVVHHGTGSASAVGIEGTLHTEDA